MTLPVRAMCRALATALCAACVTGSAILAQRGDRTPIDTEPPPSDWAIPPAPVRSPQESLALIDLPPGFRIDLVAAEPLVQDPIAFAFDPGGRLWVLEWPTYNWELRSELAADGEADPPPSRVAVLDDTDGDGRMDTRTVFAEVDWPRGFQLIGDGVLVFALPEVLFLRDTNGDGRADHREVIHSGLPIPANPHMAPSSPALTIDNWIYAHQVDRRLRYAAGTWRAEPSGRLAGQWGLSQDDYGRLFFGYNQDHLRGSLVPPHYAVRNPHYTAAGGVDVRIGVDQTVWPHALTPSVNRRAQLRDDGRLRVFTANAGPSVYRAAHFPPEFHGNVFVAEAAGRLVRRVVLSEENGILTGRNAYDGREFLFSRDERFRPVFTAGGPDGALYLADMYRGLIEGHLFVTTFLRRQVVARALHEPFHGMGRIYRITYEGRPLSTRPAVPRGAPAAWLPLLEHENGFWRDAAQRAIVAAGATQLVPALRAMASSHPEERARLHASWTLEGLGGIDAEVVRRLLRDRSPRVRQAALRIAEPFLSSPAMLDDVLPIAGDPELSVRRQLVYSLGASRLPQAQEAVLALVRRDGGEPFVVDAAVSGLAGREAAVLDRILEEDWSAARPGGRELIAALATALTNEGAAGGVDRLIGLAVRAQPASRGGAILKGIAAARRPIDPSPASVRALREAGDAGLREGASAVLAAVEERRKNVAGTQGESGTAGAGVPPAIAALVEQGRTWYTVCAGCHQSDGRGLAALAPTLRGTQTVLGAPDALIDIVLNGRDVDPAFPSMPPLAGMPDDQLAGILTYVRQAWGNAAPPITPEQVRSRRP